MSTLRLREEAERMKHREPSNSKVSSRVRFPSPKIST
jgi:hypothetical protein